MKLTAWYTPSVKPKRKGVYLTTVKPDLFYDRGFWFQYWTGTYWKLRSDTVAGAYLFKDYKSIHQEVYWKGIQK